MYTPFKNPQYIWQLILHSLHFSIHPSSFTQYWHGWLFNSSSYVIIYLIIFIFPINFRKNTLFFNFIRIFSNFWDFFKFLGYFWDSRFLRFFRMFSIFGDFTNFFNFLGFFNFLRYFQFLEFFIFFQNFSNFWDFFRFFNFSRFFQFLIFF